MNKPRIIMADTDSNYIISLQLKFIEEYFEQIDLEVITSTVYFSELFSEPQQIDILIVSENLFSESLFRHNIGAVFLMTEQPVDENTGRLNVHRIYKYTSVKDIFAEIIADSKNVMQIHAGTTKQPQIVMIYSVCGGIGKTTIAMGICTSLTRNHKRVLYINASCMQNFQYLLEDSSPIMGSQIYSELLKSGTNPYQLLAHTIRRESFSYLPPFKAPLMSWGIEYSIYNRIAQTARESGDFDYIVIDADSCFDNERARLLELADKALIITTQDRYCVCATNDLASNINGIHMDKYIFICSHFRTDCANALVASDMDLRFSISEYIDYIPKLHEIGIAEYVRQSKIPNVAMLVL